MEVTIYGKPNCGLCDGAKDKMKRMNIAFTVKDITKLEEYWRDDMVETVTVMAEYQLIDTLPVVVIDGVAMSYPKAMKMAKGLK